MVVQRGEEKVPEVGVIVDPFGNTHKCPFNIRHTRYSIHHRVINVLLCVLLETAVDLKIIDVFSSRL